MSTAPSTRLLPFGMTSLVLGTIALILALLPVLGIPISTFGLLCGIIGVAQTWRLGGVRLRWSLAGLALCAVALGLNVALAYAPAGFDWRGRNPPRIWQGPPDTPQVPAPQK